MDNPYYNQQFFGFFGVLGKRLGSFFTGQLEMGQLAADEIQLIVLMGIAISSAWIGSFLILRRMTMLANSLSHTIVLGLVVSFLLFYRGSAELEGSYGQLNLKAMLLAALIASLVTVCLTEWLTRGLKLQEDASIGLVFTTLFALGITLITLFTRNLHIGAEMVMGNVDALHLDDCKLVGLILALNATFCLLFFKEYTLTTFDPQLGRALGFSYVGFNYLLMVQLALTCVGAFRAVGVLMVLAFLTGPPLAARLFTHRLKWLIVWAIVLGVAASLIGVALARHLLTVYGLALTTGGLVVCLIGLFFAGAALWSLSRQQAA